MTCPYHDQPATAATEAIVHDEKAQLDFSRDMSYGDYLQLDAILGAQKPLSPAHDEMLFIVQHQTSELWMKLMLHELTAAVQNIATDELNAAFKQMARVSKIMEQLVHAWDVLATMTPPEYSAIRPYLGHSSGFQSFQYRCIEFAMGNKNAAMLKPHAHHPERAAMVQAAYEAPSLYDEACACWRAAAWPCLQHTGARLDPALPGQRSGRTGLAAGLPQPEAALGPVPAGEELTDLEDAFRLWRFRHVTTVERVIGFKRGTGGTGGVSYLRKMLDVVLFPEIWTLRTAL
jgi:tryptophan 2,3-dioxygenase